MNYPNLPKSKSFQVFSAFRSWKAYGLASILTQDERKSACRKHGSDNSFHPRVSGKSSKNIIEIMHVTDIEEVLSEKETQPNEQKN